MRRLFQSVLLLLMALAIGVPALVHSQDRASKRLVLKDGSYQMATKWEVKGDRVRYYSAERSMWEELPNALVDWPATNNWEKDHPKGVSREVLQLSAEEEAERKLEAAKTPEVARGLKLPYEGGVYLLDPFAGEPTLVEMVQDGGEINAERGKNILRAALNPFASVKQTIELKGTRARVQAHNGQPAFFLNVASDDADSTKKTDLDQKNDRFRIVRVQVKGSGNRGASNGTRVVGNLKIALTGKITQQGSWVAVQQEPVSGGWVKLTPAAQLAPGEYAIVEMLSPKEMNLYVWDFGVDPDAPRNDAAWRPAPQERTDTGTTKSPALEKRK
ncbi:MAG: hypothetical protein M3P27_03625 [Acidobacteriota bacterium]|nr:hypothetical protein [Acidobacteriota bacterium]